MTTAPDLVVAALQAALAGEHAAVYGYSVIGGRIEGASAVARLAVEGYSEHRTVRDALVEALVGRGESPVPTEPGYELPAPVDAAAAARELARLLEDRCGVLHAGLVATAEGGERRLAAQALLGSAVRAVRWGAPPTAFPGVSAASRPHPTASSRWTPSSPRPA